MTILEAYEKLQKQSGKWPAKDTPYYCVPPGTPHPEPCPDCGAGLLLGIFHGRLRYVCEKPGCDGNSGADENGKPVGIPINKHGRYKRWKLHGLIDPYWNDPNGEHWVNSSVRSLIYRYFSLAMNMEEFHVSLLDHEQLDKALEIAQTTFVRFMDWNHIEKKEAAGDQIIQL